MPELSLLVKPTSGDCNLACDYCFYYFKPDELYPKQKVHRMEHKVLRRLMEKYLRYVVDSRANICWQGGEPTLMGLEFFERIIKVQYMSALPKTTISNSLQTNGTLIDEKWAKFLHDNKFLVGLSLDGPADIQNFYRKDKGGKGSFDRVMRAKKLFDEYQVDYNILSVINNNNVKRGIDMYRFFKKNNLNYLQFIPCLEKDEHGDGLKKYSVDAMEYSKFLVEMFYMWATRGRYASTADKTVRKPDRFIRMFDELVIVYAGHRAPSCLYQEHCGNYFMVEHNGDVYPCDFLGEEYWKLGNIMHDSIPGLLKSKRYKEFVKISHEIFIKCEGCKWRWLCNGGCPLHWKDIYGNPSNQNYFCEAMKYFFEETESMFKSLLHFVPADSIIKRQET